MAEQTANRDERLEKLVKEVGTAVGAAVAAENDKRHAGAPASRKNHLNPTGGVKPKLKGKFFFCGALQKERFLSCEEIELYNKITVGGDYGPRKQWHVRFKTDGVTTAVFIDIPCKSIDQRMEMPHSLVEALNTILAEQAENEKKKQ